MAIDVVFAPIIIAVNGTSAALGPIIAWQCHQTEWSFTCDFAHNEARDDGSLSLWGNVEFLSAAISSCATTASAAGVRATIDR